MHVLYAYVCMYVRLYVCMYVCMYVRMYICMYVCMHVIYVHIFEHVNVHACICNWKIVLLEICNYVYSTLIVYQQNSMYHASVNQSDIH